MSSQFHAAFAYFNYWLRKEDYYSLQSPHIFALYLGLQNFLKSKKNEDLDIEEFRKELLANNLQVDVEDFGAGSKKVNTPQRKISAITKYSTSSRKFAQLYQYFCSLTPSENVIELGTCVGITSRYLSRIAKGKVYSVEGSPSLAKVSRPKQNFENLSIIEGEISETLPKLLANLTQVDFALLDANHTYQGTLSAFEMIKPALIGSSIVAVADIHWSAEMEQAWEKIKLSPEVKLSLDFYECGILIFDFSGVKSDYILEF